MPLALFVSDPGLQGAAASAFDRLGRLYAAVNAQNQIARIDRRGKVSIVAQDAPFDGPSAPSMHLSNQGQPAPFALRRVRIHKFEQHAEQAPASRHPAH